MNYANLKRVWEQLGFRSRLTVSLSGVFAVILAVGYWSLFLEFQKEIRREFDHSLYNYATDLLQSLELSSGGKADLPFEVIFSADKIFPFPHGDALVKIYRKPFTEHFSFTTDRDAPSNLDFLKERIESIKTHEFLDLHAASGKSWRGLLMPVNNSSISEIYFFVAVPRESLTSQEYKFRSIFIAGQILILGLSALMISVLATSLLQSLDGLTQSLRKMPIQNPEFKFSVPSGPPEITLLANILNQLLARIQQSLTAHKEFVAQAAHQLKTPLTIAKGHLEELFKESSFESNEDLKIALDEIDLMASTIEHLLNLVQIESGFQSCKLKKVDLLDHVMTEVDRFEYLARKKGLQFQINCMDQDAENSDWSFETDPQLLSIIVHNLLENSIKYAKISPIEIKMATRGENYLLSISNHCEGTHPHPSTMDLKNKFTRGNTPELGQGLGLYIAYKIALILNIKLNIEEQLMQFKVELEIPKQVISEPKP